MKHKITLIPIEVYKKLAVYSFIIDKDSDCEMVKFYESLTVAGKADDLAKFDNLLSLIGEKGGEERYFRRGGKYNDNIWELPDHYLFKSKFRLYCLRYGEGILIIGNGGLKTTRTYQEDPHLDKCVKQLQKIDLEISRLRQEQKIEMNNLIVKGQLTFNIEQP